jgi:uncharacterized protein
MEEILNILKTAVARHDATLLYACETGSRAWGFPSPDSDYDIRFIYRHYKDWYLQLGKSKDFIASLDGDWDLSGWDLRKSLLLLQKSNAALIERFNSPIVYYSNMQFTDAFTALIPDYYSPIAVFHHHYSLARRFWEGIKDAEQYRLKSFFYLLRSLLSCNWISETPDVVPMDIQNLMRYVDDEKVVPLQKLIALKATVGEQYLHQKDSFFHQWIIQLFEKLTAAKQNLGVARQKSLAPATELFLQTIENT